jgi:hypothetical protein
MKIKGEELRLTLIDTIKRILVGQMKSIIYDHSGSAYMKFVNLAVGIEYLGACLDHYPFEKPKESEKRFNDALKNLFDKKYHKYTKKSADVYFFEEFRCPFIHQLRPGKKIVLTHRAEAEIEGTCHLGNIETGQLVLVLEDFFDDLEKAAKKLVDEFEKGKVTNKKGDNYFISVIPLEK